MASRIRSHSPGCIQTISWTVTFATGVPAQPRFMVSATTVQHCDRQNDEDLAELKRLHAQKYIELPKKSMVLHRESCWQTASWDVFPNGNTTQLWKTTPSNEQPAVLAVQPIAMQHSWSAGKTPDMPFTGVKTLFRLYKKFTATTNKTL